MNRLSVPRLMMARAQPYVGVCGGGLCVQQSPASVAMSRPVKWFALVLVRVG